MLWNETNFFFVTWFWLIVDKRHLSYGSSFFISKFSCNILKTHSVEIIFIFERNFYFDFLTRYHRFFSIISLLRFWITSSLFVLVSCLNSVIQYYIVAFEDANSVEVFFISWMISAGFKPFKNKYLIITWMSIFPFFKKAKVIYFGQLLQQN